MPSGTPSMVRTPFTDSDDRELVAFLAVHHPSKDGRKGNAVYKLLTEQPNRWPWGKRHTWMSWRERYKNNEARFDSHIKAFQYKKKISRQAVPIGSEAMLMNGMEDLDDFGTDEEEEDEGGRLARVQSRPASKTVATPKQSTSKRKRVSDTSDRTPKRTRIIKGSRRGELEEGSSTDSSTGEKEGDAMDQDSQGEETLEVEQNLFYPSDEDSPTIQRPQSNSHESSTPKRSTRLPRSGSPVASTSRNLRTPRPREPIHRPHSPKNPPSSPFSTINLDEIGEGSPIVPKRLRKRTVPKIVERFDLLVERRAARKAGASKRLKARPAGDGMTWEELQELRRNTPEPGPSSPSTSKRGSMEPRGSSPLNLNNDQPTPPPRSRPPPSNTTGAVERKMIEAREELSKVALMFRSRLPHSSRPSSPDARINDDETHPFDETTHPFDETTHPFDETAHPFGNSQVQSQEVHPFDQDSHLPSQEIHPFDESTQQPPDSVVDSQSQRRESEVGASDIRMGVSPVPSTPGSSRRRTEAFLTASLLEGGNGRHSRNPSHPPPTSPIDRLRPGLCSPNHLPRSPQIPPTHGPATTNSPLKQFKTPGPITTSRNLLRSPRTSMEDVPNPSPQRARAGGISPDDGRPKSTVTQELRELLENSPRKRSAPANVEVRPQTHEKPPKASERKQPTHRTRFSEPSVKPETTTPGHHLRSKSMANDDPFSPPIGLRLSSPHPPMDATLPGAEQDSPLAPLTTSQNGLNATIKTRQARREAVQDRNRRVHDWERPDASRSLMQTTAVAASTTPRKGKGVVKTSVQIDGEEDEDAMDESQTYDIEQDLYDISGTPMMDLSARPPKRIPPTHRSPSHTHHRTSSPTTTNSRDRIHKRERDRDGDKSSSSRYREREGHFEKDVRDDREQRQDLRRLSGTSFGSPIAASSPSNTRRNGCAPSYDMPEGTTSNTTSSSFSSRTSFGSSTSTLSPAIGIMTGPSGLGFAPSEMDTFLGIQVACEKIAKTHGFQSDAVFRVYQEVKDLRKAEEIVIGMKRAAEKDAIERIMKVREKTERRRMDERSGGSSSHWDRNGGQSRTSRRSHDVRDEEDDDDNQETDNRIIYEEDDPDSPLRVEHLSRHDKRPSTSSTSALRHRGGYDRSRMSTTTTKARERDQIHDREGNMEYHPPTPTRANLWERLSKSGRHPETALLGESLRASLSMPRYDVVD
ncbi:hypothetical protein BDM02DRAFT_1940722 [Thelephora ganbajun]|uniref:Uncharacterized protein n=1 Tax=Thelephora ganbajun TaxID=370292 RepID=A0ACB6YZR4_THEGA|nr:hypothetical protein BDM02DRAFT_1940722 [Thelephora ganbajun]